MRKGKSVIGKPILSLADGTRLHEVKDVILGASNDTVVGTACRRRRVSRELARRPHRRSHARSGVTRWSSPDARA